MLEAEIKSQLGEYLTRLVTPVQITAYTDGGRDSAEMLDLLGALHGGEDPARRAEFLAVARVGIDHDDDELLGHALPSLVRAERAVRANRALLGHDIGQRAACKENIRKC